MEGAGLPRKRRAPDGSDAGADDSESIAAGGAGAGANSRRKPCLVTTEEVDAELISTLQRQDMDRKSAKNQVALLRKSAAGQVTLQASGPRFGGERALLAALEHEDESVFRHGGAAFLSLVQVAPIAVLHMLAAQPPPLGAALKTRIADLQHARFVSEGMDHFVRSSVDAAVVPAVCHCVVDVLLKLMQLHVGDLPAVRSSVRALCHIRQSIGDDRFLEFTRVKAPLHAAMKAHLSDPNVVRSSVQICSAFYHAEAELAEEDVDVDCALAAVMCSATEAHRNDAFIARHCCVALQALSDDESGAADKLLAQGAVRALSKVLQHLSRSEAEDPAAACAAGTKALYNLSAAATNTQVAKFPADAIIRPVLNLLRRWTNNLADIDEREEADTYAECACNLLDRLASTQRACCNSFVHEIWDEFSPVGNLIQAMRDYLARNDASGRPFLRCSVHLLFTLARTLGDSKRVALHRQGATEVLMLAETKLGSSQALDALLLLAASSPFTREGMRSLACLAGTTEAVQLRLDEGVARSTARSN